MLGLCGKPLRLVFTAYTVKYPPMKAIMVMFDSLNRHYLPPYGNSDVVAPNFARLAQKATTFESSYVCSMPCMPARRDLHTGRPNFLHRAWGQLEPFDDSVPQILKGNGVYSHLASDHYHYWEDGGATYHNRYNSWEFFRGQEGDPWTPQVADPTLPPNGVGRHDKMDLYTRQDTINRAMARSEADLPQVQTFAAGLEFLERNRDEDNWFLQIETFDPHEPFFSLPEHRDVYGLPADEPVFDWPRYQEVTQTPAQIEQLQAAYKSLLTLCDTQLGRVLDWMDENKMWDDTMLIVWTDHGFLLGEKGWTGKLAMPWWQELANTPFFIHDPRNPQPGARRRALVQPSIDLGPTLLDYFGLEPTKDMIGHDLAPVLADNTPVREAAMWGVFGGPVNITDGRHVYMRASVEGAQGPPMFTLNCSTMRQPIALSQLRETGLHAGFEFTKGCPVLQIPTESKASGENVLYDLHADPTQGATVTNAEVEAQMLEHLRRLMRECEAPAQQFERLGLEA